MDGINESTLSQKRGNRSSSSSCRGWRETCDVRRDDDDATDPIGVGCVAASLFLDQTVTGFKVHL